MRKKPLLNPPTPASVPEVAAFHRPAFCSVDQWTELTSMGRRATYEALARGELRAVKKGSRTLIDVDHG